MIDRIGAPGDSLAIVQSFPQCREVEESQNESEKDEVNAI